MKIGLIDIEGDIGDLILDLVVLQQSLDHLLLVPLSEHPQFEFHDHLGTVVHVCPRLPGGFVFGVPLPYNFVLLVALWVRTWVLLVMRLARIF